MTRSTSENPRLLPNASGEAQAQSGEGVKGIPTGELTAATERGGEQRFRVSRPRPPKTRFVTGSPPIERESPPPFSGPSLGGPLAVALQLQPVEFSGTTPPDDRLPRLKELRKWFWHREWARTPNPKTVH